MAVSTDNGSELREITDVVDSEFFRIASEADAIEGVSPRFVVEPGTPSQVARVLAIADENGLHVVPRGNGTKTGWGNRPTKIDLVMSLRRLDRVLEHAAGDMTATIEAGCTIAALQATLAERGQRLALDPLWPDKATVGGVLATADAGPMRWAFGPPRDLVLGVTVALADGTLARSGGKVVKNVAGYDLPKLFTGSFGTLGVITQATFRLHPIPGGTRDFSFALGRASVGDFVTAMQRCSLVTTAVQVRVETNSNASADVRIEGEPEAMEAKSEQVTKAAVEVGMKPTSSLTSDDVWSARERLFNQLGERSLVCKVAIRPASLQQLLSLLEQESVAGIRWQLVLQAFGVGFVRLTLPENEIAVVERLRSRITEWGGSLVVLACSSAMQSQLEVWGKPGDSLALMRRVKAQFDPNGILNAGRFFGGL